MRSSDWGFDSIDSSVERWCDDSASRDAGIDNEDSQDVLG